MDTSVKRRKRLDLKEDNGMGNSRIIVKAVVAVWVLVFVWSPSHLIPHVQDNTIQVLGIENSQLKVTIQTEKGRVLGDCLAVKKQRDSGKTGSRWELKTDGDFRLEMVWTGWRAPDKPNNADNAIVLSKRDFVLRGTHKSVNRDGAQQLTLRLQGARHPLELKIVYQLGPRDFYLRRRLALRNLDSRDHFLQKIWPRYGAVKGRYETVKSGGFGQPLAFVSGDMGIFFGLEYPAGENNLNSWAPGQMTIGCGQVMGKQMNGQWLASEAVVEAITPADQLKTRFMKYIGDIRVSPLKPYILYNTWYDLRAPEMVTDPGNILNEKNINRIIGEFETNMTEPFGLTLDAFVLDDGWDVYRSDWKLRGDAFPGGLVPISQRLAKSGTRLGIWLGPTGGYSHRDRRVEWMKAHGYETVGDQMCLAGSRYRRLLKERVVDFVTDAKVGYFKWDGIQFLCSEPDHGHPQGIYSRRWVMESLMEMCGAVRREDPDLFLNITSGTWLSPWWVKYANTIWMQGHDYGYADVPSISRRDRAMTYRDYVLFDGLREKGFWFPMANLMTHGIIKGHLQKLGGESEPLDKFTDNALLYVARGVAMWELYVSPDLLNSREWKAIADAMKWARDRFPILMTTEMVGGNPGRQEAYGYVHARDNQVVIAARNPGINPAVLSVELNTDLGINPSAKELVLEKTYPYRWISPRLTGYGDKIELQLAGFETAVFELFPLRDATLPLLAGAVFEPVGCEGDQYRIRVLDTETGLTILNPEQVTGLSSENRTVDPKSLDFRKELSVPLLERDAVHLRPTSQGHELDMDLTVNRSMESGYLAVLFKNRGNEDTTDLPQVQVTDNGQDRVPVVEEQKGKWKWIRIPLSPGHHSLKIGFSGVCGGTSLNGQLSVWVIGFRKQAGTPVTLYLKKPAHLSPQPPKPWPAGTLKRTIKLKSFDLKGNGE